MKVSLNAVKQYIDFELPPVDELVKRVNERLGKVEEIIELGPKYRGAVIVKVVEASQHPDADRLRVCLVDDGGVTPDVPRDDNGYVQVVCGAPNARAGIFAVWLPPNSTVPASFDDAEPFVLSARPLRGVLSQGMLAAGDELAINSDHDGIIEINPDEWKPGDAAITPGANFAEVYGLDDTIIDIENKMFTHRPDCFGQLGVAREIAGIFGHAFKSPEWYIDAPTFDTGAGLELTVTNDIAEQVPRLMTVVLRDIEVKPSPLWLQCELVRLGGKAINNIVDVTNYVMLLTAQPTHAYDYDKLRGHTLGARLARAGEKAELLNGKRYELNEKDIVIVDGEGVIGLGGIMGGANSEVSAETKNIVLEVATIDMYAVRKTSMRHGIFTDALTRFNKGQSPLQNDHVMSLLLSSIKDVAGGAQASDMFDIRDASDAAREVAVDATFINARLGLELSDDDITTLLSNVEISHTRQDASFAVTAPFWRTDLELPEDIVEEVGRLHGFDTLRQELPRRSMMPTVQNTSRRLKRRVREALMRAGANEVLTYSFVHENTLTKAQQDPALAFRLSNALSPDLQYYRLSITPSLLDKVHANIKSGYDTFALFEIGKVHAKQAMGEDGLPVEPGRIALTYASKSAADDAPYFHAKRLLEELGARLGLTLTYKPFPSETTLVFTRPFDLTRSARIVDVTSGQVLGILGEYAPSVKRSFKLPEQSAGFELLTEALEIALRHDGDTYRPLSRFPATTRDMCFQVSAETPYSAVYDAMAIAAQETDFEITISPLDIYQPADATTKNITLRARIVSHDRTLTADEISTAASHIETYVCEHIGATLV